MKTIVIFATTLVIAFGSLFVGNSRVSAEICYGGPGYYPYKCPPRDEIIFGGPGYYPYGKYGKRERYRSRARYHRSGPSGGRGSYYRGGHPKGPSGY